jgi:hypothetical protein
MPPLAKRRIVSAAVLLFFFLALHSAVGDSPTMDEQNHVARGLALLRTGDPRLSLEHPPLVNGLSALPLLTLPAIRLPTDHPSWERPEGWYEFAELLLWQYNRDAPRMVFLARLPVIFLTLGLALAGFATARRLFGTPAGVLALALLLFDPNLLAHGRYATTDLGGALFAFLATLLLWRLWRRPDWAWSRWALAGVGMGLAFGAKLSTLVFGPIWALLALLPLYPTAGRGGAPRRLAQLLTAGLPALLLVWGLYGFEWRPFLFRTDLLAPLNGLAGPMPTFWAGIEQILLLSGGGRPAFLLGRFSDTGFAAYFPVAFAVKTPLLTLLLWPLTAVWLLRRQETRKTAVFLLIPPLAYFLVSLQSALNIGYRHLLPMLPFVYVLVAGGVSGQVGKWASLQVGKFASGQVCKWASLQVGKFASRFAPRPSLLAPRHSSLAPRHFLYALLLIPALTALRIHPHYVSYFNLAAGGPANGYRILVDSNVDWGQDLLRLQRWMAAEEVAHVNLAWFGTADPAYYGLSYTPLPGLGRAEFFLRWWDVPFDRAQPEPGVYAISVTNLWELPLRVEEKTVFAWFRARAPDARVGYSIHIYRVPPPP